MKVPVQSGSFARPEGFSFRRASVAAAVIFRWHGYLRAEIEWITIKPPLFPEAIVMVKSESSNKVIEDAFAEIANAMSSKGLKTNAKGSKTSREIFDATTGAYLASHPTAWPKLKSFVVEKVAPSIASIAMELQQREKAHSALISRHLIITAAVMAMYKHYAECKTVLVPMLRAERKAAATEEVDQDLQIMMAMCGTFLSDVESGAYP